MGHIPIRMGCIPMRTSHPCNAGSRHYKDGRIPIRTGHIPIRSGLIPDPNPTLCVTCVSMRVMRCVTTTSGSRVVEVPLPSPPETVNPKPRSLSLSLTA